MAVLKAGKLKDCLHSTCQDAHKNVHSCEVLFTVVTLHLSLCLDKLDPLAIESLEALSSVLTVLKVIES